MVGYGYSYVTDKGFTAFLRELSEGPWKPVSIKKYDVPDQLPAGLIEAPRPVVWKLRATWAIGALTATNGATTTEALELLDGEWDSAQRSLSFAILGAAEHKDPERRAAAERLRKALLSGNGTAQTLLGYDEEVDFGRHQAEVTTKGPLVADVKAVELGPHLARIHEATEALARGLGREPGQNRAPARSKRVREALSGCSTAFNAIHEEIEWLLAHTPAGPARDNLTGLHAPLLALLDRYPPRAGAAADAPVADPVAAAGAKVPPKP